MPVPRKRSTSRPARGRREAGFSSGDLAARLTASESDLMTRAARRDLFLQILRRVNGTLDPAEIAKIALDYLVTWIPAPAWAVVVTDPGSSSSILAELDVAPGAPGGVMALAQKAIRARTWIGVADLREQPFDEATGSAFAVPLVCRDHCFGAIVGLDPEVSTRTPRLRAAAETALSILIEPIAAALEKALLLQRAEALSVTDDLTKLYNSRYLNLALRREVKRAARNRRPLSLLFVDLDAFKVINDTYGHLTGSRALVEVGGVIRDSARETDVVARFGGDEFAIILPDTGGPGARAVAERVCQRIAAYRFAVEGGRQIGLTASIGIATLPDAAGSPDALMQAADLAMYRVKERGKNDIESAPTRADT